jgi:periplasmic protein TonB
MSSDRRLSLRAAAERRSRAEQHRSLRRSLGLSVLFHGLIVALLLLVPFGGKPLEEPPVSVTVVFAEPGAAGAAGGTGEGEGGGSAKPADAEAGQIAAAPRAEAAPPAEATPPAETAPPAETTPPAPSPPEVAALPPSPEGIEEAPKPEAKPTPPAPRPKPKPQARPAPPRPAPPQQVARAEPPRPPQPSRELPPAPTATAPPEPQVADASGALPGSGPRGTAGEGPGGSRAGNGRGVSGAGRGALGDGPPEGIGDDYWERLRRWVAKYKRYPHEADKREDQGVVMLGFVIRRDGAVLDAWVDGSSGSPLLDAAAIDMVRRASPVPPLPASFTGSSIKVVIPVDYKRGFFLRNIFGSD